MRKYNNLTENDILPNKIYWAIVYYPLPSPNRNPMVEAVYYNEYRQWCKTRNDIAEIIDESIISVLREYNPERAKEIIQGGFIEDGRYNDLLSQYNFNISD